MGRKERENVKFITAPPWNVILEFINKSVQFSLLFDIHIERELMIKKFFLNYTGLREKIENKGRG